jgi:hypothetical protein
MDIEEIEAKVDKLIYAKKKGSRINELPFKEERSSKINEMVLQERKAGDNVKEIYYIRREEAKREEALEKNVTHANEIIYPKKRARWVNELIYPKKKH